jgi:hypothetical protein
MQYSKMDIQGMADRANFPDQRLNRRMEKILLDLKGKLETSIPSALGEGSQVKGCYRFLSNPAVGVSALEQVARQESLEADQDWVLAYRIPLRWIVPANERPHT